MDTPDQVRQRWADHWEAEMVRNQRWADEATSSEWRNLYQRIANGYARRTEIEQMQGAA
jgi:hypothetical protein